MTRAEIIALVQTNCVDEILRHQYREGVRTVYCNNDGDGRSAYLTLSFSFKDDQPDLLVSLVGWYSSYDGDNWDRVFLSEPYTFTETRYAEVRGRGASDEREIGRASCRERVSSPV